MTSVWLWDLWKFHRASDAVVAFDHKDNGPTIKVDNNDNETGVNDTNLKDDPEKIEMNTQSTDDIAATR